jgi:hypothetical protein
MMAWHRRRHRRLGFTIPVGTLLSGHTAALEWLPNGVYRVIKRDAEGNVVEMTEGIVDVEGLH